MADLVVGKEIEGKTGWRYVRQPKSDAVYRAMKARPDIKPDLVVGHSGFGTTLFLPELYPDTPLINYFEYYFRPHAPGFDWWFRRDLEELGWVVPDRKCLRVRCRNTMTLLDLQQCHAAYAPTEFQRSVFPAEYQPKIRTIFDGIDRSVYHGHEESLRPTIEQRTARQVYVEAMLQSALRSAAIAEEMGLGHERIIISAKVSGVQDLVDVYRQLAARCNYPLHLGLTEAGLGAKGIIASTEWARRQGRWAG